jgi:hypothetical protein
MVNGNNRLLLVHAGGSKTGSTAIQNFCELHAERLLEAGIFYGRRLGIGSKYQMGSGNGYPLYQALAAGNSRDVLELTQSHAAHGRLGLCSSEYFAHSTVDDWLRLEESCDQSGLQLKVIFFVRNVIPFLQSAFDQAVKRHGESASFTLWSETSEWQHVQSLRVLADALGPASISVVHYDSALFTLIRTFLGVMGVDSSFEVDADAASRTVNRSLTSVERTAMRRINATLGGMVAAELSDHLIYRRPEMKAQAEEVEAATVRRLVERFEMDVQWINQHFFAGQETVAVLPRPASPSAAALGVAPSDFEQERNCLTDIADWCVAKLKGSKADAIDFVANRLRFIDWHNGGNPLIPPDFDPVAYLLFNPDVLAAGVPPYEHFILAGHKEGRSHKWPNSW